MSPKALYGIASIVGGTIGGYIPDLWHAGIFSAWGILFSSIGAIAAVVFVYKYMV